MNQLISMKLAQENLSLFPQPGFSRRDQLSTNASSRKHRVQRWANFIAGYSIEFIEDCLSNRDPQTDWVLDPFLGCGTTLVAARNLGFNGIGYEAHTLFYTLSQAKLNNYTHSQLEEVAHHLLIPQSPPLHWSTEALQFISKMYSESNRELISRTATAVNSTPEELKPLAVALFLTAGELACEAQTDGIYKAPTSKKYSISFDQAMTQAIQMFAEDIQSDWYQNHWHRQPLPHCYFTSSQVMSEVASNQIGICITSPPYLNNFDFAEMTRLQLYLLGWADSWKHITQTVRKSLITNTTTALQDQKSSVIQSRQRESLPWSLQEELAPLVEALSIQKQTRAGKKEYDLLVYPYYSQIQAVLGEVFRVLAPGGQIHWVVADAALYGVHLKTHEHTKRIMEHLGFEKVQIHRLRQRGQRWLLSKREGAKEGLGEYHIIAYKN